jgi:hypothetical protein
VRRLVIVEKVHVRWEHEHGEQCLTLSACLHPGNPRPTLSRRKSRSTIYSTFSQFRSRAWDPDPTSPEATARSDFPRLADESCKLSREWGMTVAPWEWPNKRLCYNLYGSETWGIHVSPTSGSITPCTYTVSTWVRNSVATPVSESRCPLMHTAGLQPFEKATIPRQARWDHHNYTSTWLRTNTTLRQPRSYINETRLTSLTT